MKQYTTCMSDVIVENLANGIVIQAAMDLRRSLMDLKRNPFNKEARKTLDEVIQFFFSQWYVKLTTVNNMYIINRIRKEVSEWDPNDSKRGMKRHDKVTR